MSGDNNKPAMPVAVEPIIHDLDVVRVDVRMSALEPGLRALVEKLSQDLHVARAALATSRAVRNEYLEELNEIRHLLGAGPGVTALEAVKQARREPAHISSDEWARAKVLDDIRAALGTDARARRRRRRDEARAALAKANASLETERIAGRVATEFWQARITTLEAAIRNLAKVLP